MKQVHINTSSDTEEESTRRYLRPDEIERKKEGERERQRDRRVIEREDKKVGKKNRKEHPPIIPSCKVNLNAYV